MFEKLDNFRDFGGYPTRDGRRTVTGRLFRSAHHADVTDSDLRRLEDLGVQVFVDLRRTNERERQPCRRPPGFAGRIIENDIAADQEDSWLLFLRQTPDITPQAFRAHMQEVYREGPFEERHIDLFSRYFDALAEVDGGVLIHCAAGKDRTGMLAGLTHHLAGVPDEHILHDYLLTNANDGLRNRVEPVRSYIARYTGQSVPPATVLAGLVVEAEDLALSFDEMAQRCGSIDGYLRDVLNVDAAKRAAILDKILA